jgi:uncharacterized protein
MHWTREAERTQYIRFGDYILDCNRRVLVNGAHTKPITEKLFQMLMLLIAANGDVVAKEQFRSVVWPEGAASAGNLTQHMLMLRHLLGDQHHERAYIVTVSGKGYRLASTVEKKVGLTMKRLCERCDAKLRPADVAYICSYECTFCPTCAAALAKCPNCGGELVERPRRMA